MMSLEFIGCAAWLIISGSGEAGFGLLALGSRRRGLRPSVNQAQRLKSKARSQVKAKSAELPPLTL
jgi:hypothetical protein